MLILNLKDMALRCFTTGSRCIDCWYHSYTRKKKTDGFCLYYVGRTVRYGGISTRRRISSVYLPTTFHNNSDMHIESSHGLVS